ncbi:MAG: YwaF family protein [Clostridia bacterium]|nr:YwaF family protein [Clostridia bacterium]
MKLLEGLVYISNIEMEEPTAFGGFHLFCVLVVAFLGALLALRYKDSGECTFRRLIGAMFIVMLAFELMKQTLFCMSVEEGRVVYEYNWTDFPFQLCSTPLYVLPLLAFLPDGRLRDMAAAYTMTYALIGGLSTYIVPSTIFTTSVLRNIQTVVHHGIQIVSGVYTASHYRRRMSRRFFLSGVTLFSALYLVANLLNTVGYKLLVLLGAFEEGYSFNMFYVSPRADQSVPILNELFDLVSPVVFILLYFVVLSLGAALIMYAVYKLTQLSDRKSAEVAGK